MGPIVCFTSGLLDAIALHRLRTVLSHGGTLHVLSKILTLNLGVWVGMWGIMRVLEDEWGKDIWQNITTSNLTGTGPLLWSLPLWFSCHICSMSLYPVLGEELYRHLQKVKVGQPIQKKGGESTTGLLLWLFYFLHALLLIKGPQILPGLFGQHLGAISTLFGHAANCIIYSWYCVDPYLVASNLGLDDRVDLLERRYLYFLAFGLPLTLAAANLPFMVNMAVFLLFFPLSIVLAAVADSGRPYQAVSRKKTTDWWARRMPIFGSSRSLTLLVVGMLIALLPKAQKRKKG